MIDVWGLLLSSGLGLIIGMLVGLIPGLGVSSTFLLIAPVLVTVHPVYGLFVFVSLLTASQYFGSITALTYGVPGEISSYPVIAERPYLLHIIDVVLKQTALGSLAASMFALIFFVMLMSLGNFWVYIYNYRVFAWVLGLAVVATVLFGSKKNSIWTNVVLFGVGAALARIGFNKDTGSAWGTFSIADLYTGVPLPAVALGLLVVPVLWTQHQKQVQPAQGSGGSQPIAWASIGRGSVLGLIGGLVPGVTYMASTQLSYVVERWLNRTRPEQPLRSVVASSSADNAGAVSSLYPLLWLGIPISLGEAMVVWLFDQQNLPLNWSTVSQPVQGIALYWLLILCFVIVNVASYCLSWPGRALAIKLAQHLLSDATRYVIIAVTLIAVFLLANEAFSSWIFWSTFVIAGAIGIVTKRLDWMPLIIGFILQDSIEMTLFKVGAISI